MLKNTPNPRQSKSHFEPSPPSRYKTCLQRDVVAIQFHSDLLGTCPGRVAGGTGQDSALGLAWGNEQLAYALENYKPCEVGPLGTTGKRVHIEMLPGGGGICNGS